MIRLRPAEKADLPRLFALDQICFPAGIAYSLRDFRSLLRSARVLAVVAEEKDALAGFAMAQTVLLRGIRTGQIVTIDVAPEYRRRGVGRLLMDSIEAGARSAGAGLLRLEVAVDNSEALAFYANLGYVPIRHIRGYYHGTLDAIGMEKTLAETMIQC
jgi:ribosomal-protein-alanine N-acetyltransferase